ncbi:hypothetical protein Cgig2_017008 [Carnegiea gigantea]|uniref:Uncharacterized protein n=1 Tax=Carnegiea gigantea TaxID=171969 RepID=A0A9Q1KHC1_9CARY|nr:hypothetical protein Cgig2_017008 [Carnegiea gigantea]
MKPDFRPNKTPIPLACSTLEHPHDTERSRKHKRLVFQFGHKSMFIVLIHNGALSRELENAEPWSKQHLLTGTVDRIGIAAGVKSKASELLNRPRRPPNQLILFLSPTGASIVGHRPPFTIRRGVKRDEEFETRPELLSHMRVDIGGLISGAKEGEYVAGGGYCHRRRRRMGERKRKGGFEFGGE